MDQARDRNGKTEQEFLRDYDVTKYFRPSVTVDAVLYSRIQNGVRLLMIKRGGHPFIGRYAFPGGFVEQAEPCEVAAARELEEETGVTGVPLKQLVAVSTPDRDPRWRNITVVFYGEIADGLTAKAGDDAADAQWFDITYVKANGRLDFACADTGEKFVCKLDVVRDAFGKIDLNGTTVTEYGSTAFDHAKLIAYLIEEIGEN